MKILITGMNKAQCTRKFYLRQQLKVVPSHYSLYNCLVDMGHEVDQRMVELGEDLSEYDEVIVFIAGPRQLVATTVFNGLWAISAKPDCILSFDDWQVPDLFKGIAKCVDWKELTAQFILDVNKKTLEDVEPFKDELLKATNIINTKQNRMLITAFQSGHLNDPETYGPHLLFDKIQYPRDKMYVMNPNPYHRNRSWEDSGHEGKEDPTYKVPSSPLSFNEPHEHGLGRPIKQKIFNFASLVQSKTQKWLKKQGYTGNPKNDEQGDIGDWVVDLYGSKADTQKRLTEDQMVQVITRDWGCLMPGYEHAGSGWWRARPLQCADAGSILIGEEKELRVYYGDEYPYYGLTAKMVTEASDEELQAIATAQYEYLHKLHPLDEAVQQAEINAILVAAK